MDASSTITSWPGCNSQRRMARRRAWAVAASREPTCRRPADRASAAWSASRRSWSRRPGLRLASCSHLAVFSVGTSSEPASTRAAFAVGASPNTLPVPCSASHARRRAANAVVLPAPAAPTSRSNVRPEVATASTAAA